MLDLGFIKSKADSFIVNRRFSLMIKQKKDADSEFNPEGEQLNSFFLSTSKSIMSDFFEERADEVAAGIIEKWQYKQQEEIKRNQRHYQVNIWNGLKALARVDELRDFRSLKYRFAQWKQAFRLTEKAKFQEAIDEEREKRIIAEASLTALQIELRENLEKVERFEQKEFKRIEKKKRKIMQKRKEQFSKEVSRSLTVQETPLRVEEKMGDGDKSKLIVRRAFNFAQRGSVNTEMRQKRLQDRLLINRNSVASCSVYSRAKSEFSFHPSINYDSKWKPKYDDHHDHKKMWRRMHDENEKINRKKRLMSEQKSRDEMFGCTFTPDLVTKKADKSSEEPLDIKHLSLRLYQYADKFKDK